MVKVNVEGCSSFINSAEYQKYVGKAFAAYDTLEAGDGEGNDFLGWKTLPVDTPESLRGQSVQGSRRRLEGLLIQALASLFRRK